MAKSQKKIAQVREKLEASPAFESVADLMTAAGDFTRLKILYLIQNRELSVGDLAEILGVTISSVSQHLTRLKAYRLVSPRRQAQTIFYRLTDHSFNAKLREIFFSHFHERGVKP